MMRRRMDQRFWPAAVGIAVLLILLAAWTKSPIDVRHSLRERTLDQLLPLLTPSRPVESPVLVIDIDRTSLEKLGPWPWPRTRLARLLEAVAAANPSVIGLDVLLADPDRLSPAVLVREIAAMTGRQDISALANGLEDGDAAIAAAISQAAAVLGFVLETKRSVTPPDTVPFLVRGSVNLPRLWISPNLLGPTPQIASAAAGLGLLSLDTDVDGRIRRLPLLVYAAAAIRPGFAVEVVRLAQQAAALIIEGASNTLKVGELTVPLDPDASIRIVASGPHAWARRTISAATLLEDASLNARLTGRVVLVGGSAPELGGLRVTAASPVAPTVQIQADAINTLLGGVFLVRPEFIGPFEVVVVALLGFAFIGIALLARPLIASLIAAGVIATWCVAVVAVVRGAGILLDPAAPPLFGIIAFICTALTRFVGEERRARALRLSFEQHVAPSVVRRISAEPTLVRLQGEMREITSLFTDIEGFTAMTEQASPTDLVALLDEYLDAVTRTVIEHGGMVDKIVGDAVHAIFNAPLDLSDHPRHAMECALSIVRSSDLIRMTARGQKLLLGRTRVGIETGPAIVGDVGGSYKLDYTAYGTVVNTAARLEAANKMLASTILIGPIAAAHLDPTKIRSVGRIELRGRSAPVEVFTPITEVSRSVH